MLTRIQTPLFVSGATPMALQQFMPDIQFIRIYAGPGRWFSQRAGCAPGAASQRLEAGSSVNVEMIRGDISYSANGTVTYVDGDKVYAFGHPNLGAGSTDCPCPPVM